MTAPTNLQESSTVLIVRSVLDNLDLGSLPSANTDWPIYMLTKPDSPDNAIVVYETERVNQGRYMINGALVQRKGIQLQIRSASPAVGDLKINSILVALTENYTNQTVTISDVTYIIPSFSVTSGPIPLGQEVENSRRWMHSLNLTSPIYQQTS